MKKRILLALVAVVMASMMLVTSVSAASVDTFTDKNEWPDWAANSISYVIENDLMSGTGAGRFDYAGQVTRAQMAQMLYNLDKAVYGEPTIDSESKFEDLDGAAWAVTAINWAADKGIVTGTNAEGTAFNPTGLITNGAMAKMLYGYAQYRGFVNLLDITRVDEDLVPVEMFYEDMMGEWSSTDWWYESAIACGNAALLIGSPNPEDEAYPLFNLNGTSMRAQAATVLTRLHKFLMIETLEAEIIMDEWNNTYNKCAHPGQVHFLYSRNAPRQAGSPELNQMIISEENIQTAFESMFDIDFNEWRIEIPQLAEIRLAFRGQSEYFGKGGAIESGGVISNVEFALVNIANPEIRMEETIHMTMRTSHPDYYHITETYGSNQLGFGPSAWICNDYRDNYHEEVTAYLDELQAQWLAAVKQSDGKIHIAVDPDYFDKFNVLDIDEDDGSAWYAHSLFGQTMLRALYHSWQGANIVKNPIIFAPIVKAWECIEYDFDNVNNPFYNAEWGDVPTEYPKYDDGTPKMFIDGDPTKPVAQEDISLDGVGTPVYVDENGDTKSIDPYVTARSQGPKAVEAINALKTSGKYEVTLPLYFKVATDVQREGSVGATEENVTIVFESNNNVMLHGESWAQVVVEAETPTVDALGDFYCAECGAINIAASTTWSWGQVWRNPENHDQMYIEAQRTFLKNDAAATEINKQDFLLYQLRLHAGAHMDITKYTIVGASFNEEQWIGGGHGNTTTFELTLKIGKAADPSFAPVEIKVPCHIEVNQNIHTGTFDDNDGLEEFSTDWIKNDGNKGGRMGDHFGCPHTDPKKDPNTFLNNLLDTYYCELHETFHVNVHDAAQLVKNANVTNSIKALLTEQLTGDGGKSGRYNEGIYAAKANTPLVTVTDKTAVGAVTVTLDGFYSTEVAYITVPVTYALDTQNPTTGLIPAQATLTNPATGETKALCTSTEEYKAFLAEVEAGAEQVLDEKLAPFTGAEPGVIYYNPTHVFGHWDVGFVSQTLLEKCDLEGLLIHLTGGDADRFKNDVDFQGVFTHKDNGQWTWAEDTSNNRVEDGAVTGQGKIKVTVYLACTGKAVTKELNVKYISSWTIDGSMTSAPTLTHADYEVAAEKKLRDALAEVTKNGAITVYYNTNKPEAYNFGEYVGNAIAKKAGLVLDPNNRYNMPKYTTNDYHVVRLEKFGDSWNNYDPSEMPNGWLIGNGEKACENTNVSFEWLLSKPTGVNKSIFIDINVTLICDTSLPMNTAEVR